MIIVRNSAKCKKCRQEAVSKHVHDFKSCLCGAISVDGGREYLRRAGNFEDFEDTSLHAVIIGTIRHDEDYKKALEGMKALDEVIKEYEAKLV